MNYFIIHGLKKQQWYIEENPSEPLHSFESLNLQSVAFVFGRTPRNISKGSFFTSQKSF